MLTITERYARYRASVEEDIMTSILRWDADIDLDPFGSYEERYIGLFQIFEELRAGNFGTVAGWIADTLEEYADYIEPIDIEFGRDIIADLEALEGAGKGEQTR